MAALDPLACAVFLLVACVSAGAAQNAGFANRRSRAFAVPLDAGLTWRGRRPFGASNRAPRECGRTR